MAINKEESKKPESKSVKDLEGLSDEELDGVSGGNGLGTTMTTTCCKSGGGGGCGTNTGTSHEANIIGQKGDVELNPTKKR